MRSIGRVCSGVDASLYSAGSYHSYTGLCVGMIKTTQTRSKIEIYKVSFGGFTALMIAQAVGRSAAAITNLSRSPKKKGTMPLRKA